MTNETTLTLSSTHGIESGDTISIPTIEVDNRLWRWIVAFVFRLKKPTIIVMAELKVKEKCSGTTLTIEGPEDA